MQFLKFFLPGILPDLFLIQVRIFINDFISIKISQIQYYLFSDRASIEIGESVKTGKFHSLEVFRGEAWNKR